MGKAKASVRGTQLLVFTKAGAAVEMALGADFALTVQNELYGSFYDASGQNWSLLFKSADAVAQFAVQVAAGKLRAGGARDVVVQELVVGTAGKLAIDAGDTVGVKYTGYLVNADGSRGAQFDGNDNSAGVLKIKMGDGGVIAGLERGLRGMRKGGRRLLVIPPQLGYGGAGSPSHGVPADATLAFDVAVTKLKSRDPNATPAASAAASPSASRRSRANTSEQDQKADLVARMARLGQASVPGTDLPQAQQQQQQPQPQAAVAAAYADAAATTISAATANAGSRAVPAAAAARAVSLPATLLSAATTTTSATGSTLYFVFLLFFEIESSIRRPFENNIGI